MNRVAQRLPAACMLLLLASAHLFAQPAGGGKSLWVSLTASGSSLTNRQSIVELLDRTRRTGFDTVILYVKEINGEVTYPSRIAPRLTQYKGSVFPSDLDLLRIFVEEAHHRGLRLHAAFEVFSEGDKNSPEVGPAFTTHREWQTVAYDVDAADNKIKRAPWGQFKQGIPLFVNAALPAVRDYEISIITEVVHGYDVDGIVLDRARWQGINSDFSEESRSEFLKYVHDTDVRWPEDVYQLSLSASGSKQVMQGRYYSRWLEWRATVIHDFIATLGAKVRQMKPHISFESYVGSWYPNYYEVGVNWGSNRHPVYYPWATPEYAKTGYAELVDVLYVGLYYQQVTEREALASGLPYWNSVEGGTWLARDVTEDATKVVGVINLGDDRLTDADVIRALPIMASVLQGTSIFERSHVARRNQWELLQREMGRFGKVTSAVDRSQAMPLSGKAPTSGEEEDKWVEDTLRNLSLRERIGQLLLVGCNGDYGNFRGPRFQETRRHIEQEGMGGFVMYGGDANEIAALSNQMQRLSKIPLLIAADYETDLRMQARSGTAFPSNMGIAAGGRETDAYKKGRIIAGEMRAIGVNWLFGPVADLNSNPDNPVINVRSFGEDPDQVGRFVVAFIRGVQAGGAMATVKHFPGHGDTAIDSHLGLPLITAERAQLESRELAPFHAAISAGVDAVMTGHLLVPAFSSDGAPASLDSKITNGLLRSTMGYNGIVVTDSLTMGSVQALAPGEGALRAVEAGADVALLAPDPKAAIAAIGKAVESGDIREEQINVSVRRILHAKYRLGLAQQRLVNLESVNRAVEVPRTVEDGEQMAERSLTLLRNTGNFFPLTLERAQSTAFIVIAADDSPEEGRRFAAEVFRRVPNASVVRVDPRSTSEEYGSVLTKVEPASQVVVACFVRRAALKGTVALPQPQVDLVKKLISAHPRTAVVAFGSPYIVRQFPEVPVYLASYGVEEVMQATTVRGLFGEAPITGKLPIRIPGLFKLGEGLELPAAKQIAAPKPLNPEGLIP